MAQNIKQVVIEATRRNIENMTKALIMFAIIGHFMLKINMVELVQL